MTKQNDQFIAFNQTAVETAQTIASTVIASTERLAALNLNTAREAVENAVTSARSLMSAKDPQEFFALQAAMVQPNLGRAIAYGRATYDLALQTQSVFGKLFETRYADFQKSVSGLVDQAAAKAPAGSEVAVAAVKSAFAAANSAIDNMNKAAKQVAEITQNNVNAATAALEKKAA